MSKQLRLDVAQLTDVGRKRPHNEDNMAYVIPKDEQAMARKGALFIVADGMGGHAAGEVASEIAVDTVSKVYYQDDTYDVTTSLVQAIKRANALIHQRAAENLTRSGMGTTCVSIVTRGNMAYIANVGDSRAYRVRRGQVQQISQDHSWVEEQVRAGLLTRDQARAHSQRNVITRCLGTQSDVEIDIFTERLEEGDSLILCSDGLSGYISDDDLRVIVDQYVPQESVYHLVERANENGGPDNITAIVIRVLEVGVEPPDVRHPVSVGGREAGEETTMALNQSPAAPGLPGRSVDGRFSTGHLYGGTASGSLPYTDTVKTAPLSPSTKTSRPSRLFFPTLALAVLLLLALLAGGAYWYLSSNNVKGLFDSARASIQMAQQQITSDPDRALNSLQAAQTSLNTAQKSSLTGAQSSELKDLEDALTRTTRDASSAYNKKHGITTLCPAITTSKPISDDTTSPRINIINIAAIQNGKNKTFYYVLGDDQNLYQLDDQQKLVGKSVDVGGEKIITLSSDGMRILAIGQQKNNDYTLNVLTPDDNGVLKSNATTIDPKYIGAGYSPKLMASWGGDVFILLPLTSAPTNAKILHFTIQDDTIATQPTPVEVPISTTNGVTTLAVFPDRQLFLLDMVGGVYSYQFPQGGNAPQATLVQVVVQPAVTSPLNVDSTSYTAATPVPQIPDAQKSPYLFVQGATLLAAGPVKNDKDPHLFVVDNTKHRILELKTAPSAVPTGNAGGVQGGGLKMNLLHQYTSLTTLDTVKGVVVDPAQVNLSLVTQKGTQVTSPTFVSIDVTQNAACS